MRGGNLVTRMKMRGLAADVGAPVARGGVPIFNGDTIVGEGVVAVPAGIAAQVAEAGMAMDHIEAYVHGRLRHGDPLPGLYPPGDKACAEYDEDAHGVGLRLAQDAFAALALAGDHPQVRIGPTPPTGRG